MRAEAEVMMINYFRPCCAAENLITVASKIMRPAGQIVFVTNWSPLDEQLCVLALKFAKKSPAFKFRALFEEWSLSTIAREMDV